MITWSQLPQFVFRVVRWGHELFECQQVKWSIVSIEPHMYVRNCITSSFSSLSFCTSASDWVLDKTDWCPCQSFAIAYRISYHIDHSILRCKFYIDNTSHNVRIIHRNSIWLQRSHIRNLSSIVDGGLDCSINKAKFVLLLALRTIRIT